MSSLWPARSGGDNGLGTRWQTGAGYRRKPGNRTCGHAEARSGGGFYCRASRQSSAELESLCEHGDVAYFGVDLSSDEGPSDLIASALKNGPIDILVNNAGAVTPRLGGFLSVTDDQFWATLTLTFMAAVRITREVLPHMIERGSGNIVNNASVNASLPDPLVIDYSAAKAALWNFSKALSKEVGRHGIRVNSVSAGPVSTGLWLGDHGVAATVAAAHGAAPIRSRAKRSKIRLRADLQHPRKSRISSSSWPASVPPTSPARTM